MRIEPKSVPTPRPAPAPQPGLRTSAAPTAPLSPKLGTDALSLSGSASGTTNLSDVVAKAREAAAKRPEWTMAVNLAASLGDQFGAVSKSQQLKDLAKETEGKPVTLVAQQVTKGPDGPVVERFVIKDGKATSMGQSPSEGFAKDLQALTAMASQDHPATRMGVIIQSHGNAIDGMSGDNGGATLSQISDALRQGLEAGGRGKLDVLDFDACLMGQQEVLSAMGGVADHVLASPEVELANGVTLGEKVDGQSMQQMMRALLANPEMDGAAFADKAVEIASQGARPLDVDRDGKADPGNVTLNATPTLSHFDMQHLGAMTRAVDGLGSALTEVIKDPKSRRAVEDLIARSPRFSATSAEGDGVGLQQRDLKRFSEGLQEAIAQGKVADPSGKLKEASTAVLQAMNDLVDAYHGENVKARDGVDPQDYGKLGGIGVFMPSAEFLKGTPETLATSLDRIVWNADSFATQITSPAMNAEGRTRSKELFMNGASGALDDIWRRLPESRRSEFAPLRDAYFALDKAKTPTEISNAAKRFGKVASELKGKPLGQMLDQQVKQQHQQLVDEAFSLARPHMAEGWSQFTQALK